MAKTGRRTVVTCVGVGVAMAFLAGACNGGSEPTLPPGTIGTLAPDNASCGGLGPLDVAVPAGLGAGDLVKAEELTAAGQATTGFPQGARAWRIQYVSTGVDEDELKLICGTVTAPVAGPTTEGGAARMLAWSHGTVGLAQKCLPSNNPSKGLWGVMPGGIGAIGFADPAGLYQGDPAGGALQYAMDQGWVVAATDYEPDDTYVLGKIAGGNVLDSTRAAAQLVEQEKLGTAPERYKLITWGHSQGGHAALWAGQLADTYLAGTKPSKHTPTIELAGVVALAPASNFVVDAPTGGATGTTTASPTGSAAGTAVVGGTTGLGDASGSGHGLADWEMHKTIEALGLPIPDLEIEIGPALFSYIFGSWAEYAKNRAPSTSARFPAFPSASAKLDPAGVLTPQGQGTVSTITPLCLEADGKQVQAAVNPYIDAKTNQMLTPPVWNLPVDYQTGQFFPGGLDTTCATTADKSLIDWCAWIQWNMPGPRGENPYPKVPMHDGRPVPLMIGQGMADTVIHCSPPPGASASVVPDAGDCMSRALYDDLQAEYCPAGEPAGFLSLHAVRGTGLGSPASHQSIPGQLSANNWTFRGSQMTFTGSPVETFMGAAFAGTLTPGCNATVENP